jgi:hypothetical protein
MPMIPIVKSNLQGEQSDVESRVAMLRLALALIVGSLLDALLYFQTILRRKVLELIAKWRKIDSVPMGSS